MNQYVTHTLPLRMQRMKEQTWTPFSGSQQMTQGGATGQCHMATTLPKMTDRKVFSQFNQLL